MQRNLKAGSLVKLGEVPARRVSFGFFPFCWAIYLIATPFFLFEAGYPQPADGLMAMLILVLLTGYALVVPKHPSLFLVAALFLGHVAVVNWIWWVQYKDSRFILSSIYYAYNCCVFLFVISLFQRYGANIIGVTRVSLMIAAVAVLAFCLVAAREGRAIGTFNNPNQLGYWSLLAVACYLVLKGDGRFRLADVAFLATVSYLAALSLSKAAMLSLFALLVTAVIGQSVDRRLKVAAIVMLLAVTPLAVLESETIGKVLSETTAGRVADRLESIGQQRDDSLEYRGYDRLWLYPQYLILGAGEGAYDRFRLSKAPHAIEIHSTFATLLFCYGIVGFGLLGTAVYLVLRQAPWRHVAYFFIFSFYGLTHQGLRFSLMWVFLGLVFGMVHYVRRPLEAAGSHAMRAAGPQGDSGAGLALRARTSGGTAT